MNRRTFTRLLPAIFGAVKGLDTLPEEAAPFLSGDAETVRDVAAILDEPPTNTLTEFLPDLMKAAEIATREMKRDYIEAGLRRYRERSE